MPLTFKHQFVSPKVDGVDMTLVQPSSWNADHIIAGGTKGDLLVYDPVEVIRMNRVAAVAVGQVLVSAGLSTLPAWSASPTLTSVTASFFASTGTVPASGVGRFANGTYLYWKNAAGNADLLGIGIDSSNNIFLGQTTSNVLANSDNVQSLGDGTHRFSSGHFGTALAVGTNPALTGDIRGTNTFALNVRNFANGGDENVIAVSANNITFGDAAYGDLSFRTNGAFNFTGGLAMYLGGTPLRWGASASPLFPSLKRNGVTLQVRLADDTGDGSMSAYNGTFSNQVVVSGWYVGPGVAATVGDFRAQNGFTFTARNSGNTADGTILKLAGVSDANNGADVMVISGPNLPIIAVNGTLDLTVTVGAGPTIVFIAAASENAVCIASLNYGLTTVTILFDPASMFSTVQGTAGKYNLYWLTNRFKIENKQAGARQIKVINMFGA